MARYMGYKRPQNTRKVAGQLLHYLGGCKWNLLLVALLVLISVAASIAGTYLLKPISYADFMEAVNKAVRWFELQQKAESVPSSENTGKYIYVKSDYKLIQIELNKILYIEGLKDYIKIHLEGAEKPVLSLISMRAMEEKLPASQFIRVHRSFIVQKQKIKIIDKGRIVFGKDYVPVSDSYKQELQNYVNEHIV